MNSKEMDNAIDALLKSLDFGEEKETFTISEEEYSEYSDLKSKESKEIIPSETLYKSYLSDGLNKELIREVIKTSVQSLRDDNISLKKQLDDQNETIDEYSRRPQLSKSITSIETYDNSPSLKKSDSDELEGVSIIDRGSEELEELEKSKPNQLSKSQVLDVAEGLFKSGKLRDTHIIELENSGKIFDKQYNDILQKELNKR